MTTSCWGDVVFTEKTFRVVSYGFVDGGFEEFRNFGFRGTEGLEGLEGLEDFFTSLHY